MHLNKKHIIRISLAGVSLLTSSLALSATVGNIDGTTIKFGGYVKLDAMSTQYKDGEIPANSWLRDFYVPSTTPVDGEGQNRNFDMHARQSRFNLGTETEIDGHKLSTFFEMDFMTHADGNERVSNSYSPRMRHAFFKYDNWLFGQTWTTFQNLTVLPETADFIGNTDFGIFVRQAQIRYTSGPWQFAIENPETTVTNSVGGRIVTDDNELPDFVGRYNYSSGSLSLTFAVLARQLTYNDGNDIDSSTTALGLSASGKYTFGSGDDIRFGVNTGSGMGRYIGLNVANGAAITSDNELEAIDSTATYIAFRHLWNSKLRSNITYSQISIDHDTDLTSTDVTAETASMMVNLMYSPTSKLTFGGEFAMVARELESDVKGKANRLQFFGKLAF